MILLHLIPFEYDEHWSLHMFGQSLGLRLRVDVDQAQLGRSSTHAPRMRVRVGVVLCLFCPDLESSLLPVDLPQSWMPLMNSDSIIYPFCS